MRKKERLALADKLSELLSSYGGAVVERAGSLSHSLETELLGDYGRVSVSAYIPTDAKENPWLACQFRDWTGVWPATWRGWDHWKRNIYGRPEVTADAWVAQADQHLRKLLHERK
jgi:hypothetical protein